jgi:hypothetical protein
LLWRWRIWVIAAMWMAWLIRRFPSAAKIVTADVTRTG